MSALTVEPYVTDLEAWRAEIEAKRQQRHYFKALEVAAVDAENDPTRAKKVKESERPGADKVIRLYVDERMTASEVSRALGWPYSTVNDLLKRAGVIRDRREAALLRQERRRAK